jgi:hypothetical protein
MKQLTTLLFWAIPILAQAQFTLATNNNTITIVQYTGTNIAVTIPGTTNDLSVGAIGTRAFQSCTNLACVTIPDSVTIIGSEAFSGCASLTNVSIGNGVTIIGSWAFVQCTSLPNVTIGNNVTNIEEYAFQYCSALTNVTIPNKVISIGDFAFDGCYGLASVTIPNSVLSIGEYAFLDCSNLISIAVDANNPSYSSAAGVLFNQNQTVLVESPGGLSGGYTVPDRVTNIGSGAFYDCNNLTGVAIANSVISIGDYAFYSCLNLAGMTIGTNVTSIGNAAFQNCPHLTNIIIPDSVTNLGVWAFANCWRVANVSMGNGLAGIGGFAFYACDGLANVTIPDCVADIGVYAFLDCSSLTSVILGSGVTNIEDYAFSGCTFLTAVYAQGNAPSADCTVFQDDWYITLPDYTYHQPTIYCLPNATGWGWTFACEPTALEYQPSPAILVNDGNLGVTTNGFGFTIAWATNVSVVVLASTNLSNPVWTPLATNPLVNGAIYFSDPQWTNYPSRYYRIISQ